MAGCGGGGGCLFFWFLLIGRCRVVGWWWAVEWLIRNNTKINRFVYIVPNTIE